MAVIERESRPSEMVFTTDNLYELFILNENRSDKAPLHHPEPAAR